MENAAYQVCLKFQQCTQNIFLFFKVYYKGSCKHRIWQTVYYNIFEKHKRYLHDVTFCERNTKCYEKRRKFHQWSFSSSSTMFLKILFLLLKGKLKFQITGQRNFGSSCPCIETIIGRKDRIVLHFNSCFPHFYPSQTPVCHYMITCTCIFNTQVMNKSSFVHHHHQHPYMYHLPYQHFPSPT